jgi:hypothetical protein
MLSVWIQRLDSVPDPSRNLPHVRVVGLVYHQGTSTLIAATYGRSLWRIQVRQLLVCLRLNYCARPYKWPRPSGMRVRAMTRAHCNVSDILIVSPKCSIASSEVA